MSLFEFNQIASIIELNGIKIRAYVEDSGDFEECYLWIEPGPALNVNNPISINGRPWLILELQRMDDLQIYHLRKI